MRSLLDEPSLFSPLYKRTSKFQFQICRRKTKAVPRAKIKARNAPRVIKLSEFASKPQAKERKGDQGKETAASACGTQREG